MCIRDSTHTPDGCAVHTAALHLLLPSGAAAPHLLLRCTRPSPQAQRRSTCCCAVPAAALLPNRTRSCPQTQWRGTCCCAVPAAALPPSCTRSCPQALRHHTCCCAVPAAALPPSCTRTCPQALRHHTCCCAVPAAAQHALLPSGAAAPHLLLYLPLHLLLHCCRAVLSLALRRCGAALAVAPFLLLRCTRPCPQA